MVGKPSNCKFSSQNVISRDEPQTMINTMGRVVTPNLIKIAGMAQWYQSALGGPSVSMGYRKVIFLPLFEA